VFGNTENFAIDQNLQADVATGPAAHKMLFGVDYYRTVATSGFRGGRGTSIDAFDPAYGAPQIPISNLPMVVNNKGDLSQIGAYIQDQMKIDRFVLFLTGRSDAVENMNFNKLTVSRVDQIDHANTGRVGLSYVLPSGFAPYVLYSTSFQPTSGVDALGQPYKPTTGSSQEVGIKYEPVGVNALFTAALYDTTQQNVLTPDPINPLFSVQTGEVNVKGYEFEGRASLSDRLDMIGGYSRLDPRVTKSNAGNQGYILPNVALDTASLWGVYTIRDGFFAGLALGGGARYTGRLYADNLNTIVVPPYLLFDAMLSYDFSYVSRELRGLKFQINATNIGNKYYVANCFGLTYCSLGSERTILASLKYQWPRDDAADSEAKLGTGLAALNGRQRFGGGGF